MAIVSNAQKTSNILFGPILSKDIMGLSRNQFLIVVLDGEDLTYGRFVEDIKTIRDTYLGIFKRPIRWFFGKTYIIPVYCSGSFGRESVYSIYDIDLRKKVEGWGFSVSPILYNKNINKVVFKDAPQKKTILHYHELNANYAKAVQRASKCFGFLTNAEDCSWGFKKVVGMLVPVKREPKINQKIKYPTLVVTPIERGWLLEHWRVDGVPEDQLFFD